ncbi:MAG: radical SAM protein [Chloroflexota bacterium]|nr:radical SAM protein [Chloroflexota bacterium]
MLVDNNHLQPDLRLVAWEVTRQCNLHCAHCRAAAEEETGTGELSIQECFKIIDGILEVGRPILILTGGEPLLRPDIFEIGKYATDRGLRVVLGTNGTAITGEIAARMAKIPISRAGISIDFPEPELQDRFRGKAGAFDSAMDGIKAAQKAGIEIQINSTITRMNAPYLDDLLSLALKLGAVAFHPFMLVPTGRGKGLADVALSPEEHERILNWIYDRQSELGERMFFKPTDAPHYMRIALQRKKRAEGNPQEHPMNAMTRGCLAGVGFCFISHVGQVQGCGYLDVQAGDLNRNTFADVWNKSPVFGQLRDLSRIKGKCGECEYRQLCGGCRARAYEATGDYLEAEPFCVYQPAGVKHVVSFRMDEIDRSLVNLMQARFPLTRQPFADIAASLNLTESEVLQRVSRLRESSIVRIIGPVFNSRTLGYQSTLVAMRVPSARIEQAAHIISQHPGVGHNYQRDHYYNLWFTLAIRSETDLNAALNEFEQQIKPEDMLELPALRIFKIRLFFDMEGNGRHSADDASVGVQGIVPLEPPERAVINEVQQNLPLVSRPFDEMAARIGMDIKDFLTCCRSLLNRGIMRRFGASIEHVNAGFTANTMVCWAVPQEHVDEVGQRMAALPEVTHCYERRTNTRWPRYNMFTMIHGKTREDNENTVEQLSRMTGITEYQALPTIREFKKERVKYHV